MRIGARAVPVRAATTASARPPSATGSGSELTRSAAKKRRKITYSIAIATIHGSDIRPANRTKLTPLAANASRFVRLAIGSSSDAEFARWVQA